MDNIANVIADAKAQAASLPQASPASPSTAVALPGKRTTAASFLDNARVNVDVFLKIDKTGPMRIGSAKGQIGEFEAVLDCSKLAFPMMVRYGDNPTVYAKTYDGGATVQDSPTTWQRHLELAQASKPGKQSAPFDTVDLALRLVSDVTGYELGKSEIVGKAGQLVGYTPPYTGVATVHALLKEVRARGGDIEKSKVRVKVTGTSKSNKAGQPYGIVELTFLGLEA